MKLFCFCLFFNRSSAVSSSHRPTIIIKIIIMRCKCKLSFVRFSSTLTSPVSAAVLRPLPWPRSCSCLTCEQRRLLAGSAAACRSSCSALGAPPSISAALCSQSEREGSEREDRGLSGVCLEETNKAGL